MLTQIEGSIVTANLSGCEIHFLVTDKNDLIQKSHAQGQFYENEELAIIGEFFPQGGVFVDVGANIGNHSIYVGKFLHPREIIVFEPNPPAIEILRANINLNGLQPIVNLSHIGVGLSDTHGNANASIPIGNLGATRLTLSAAGSTTLPLIAGDSALRDRPVSFFKIDVEGMEMRVLAGLEATISNWRPAIFVEIENGNVPAFLNWIKKHDYHIVRRYRRYQTNENYLVVPTETSEQTRMQFGPSPRYAVLFKTHFWDDFVERQYKRLCDRVGTGQLFIVIDETKAPVLGIAHENVVRVSEHMAESEGYLRFPVGNVFWYNTDYQLYHFIDNYPEFEYIFTCEYDCAVNIEISTIVESMAKHDLCFVGQRISTHPSVWHWTPSARPFYAETVDISGRLLCCAAFRRDFVRKMQASRREHTRRVLANVTPGTNSNKFLWPNNEAFVGAEIALHSAAELPLSAFGDTSRYDWAPPHLEIELRDLATPAVVHPVLDTRRYMRSLVKLKWDLNEVFRVGSELQVRMEQIDPGHVITTFLSHFVDTKNWGALEKLRDYAIRRVGNEARSHFNVARGKRATQSSTCVWSHSPYLSQDASGAINGQISGRFGFHTDLEDSPWWCVDLEAIHPVREIRIFNRLDVPERSRSLVVSTSTDIFQWTPLYRHDSDSDFGGADGMPLLIQLVKPIELRFLRVHLPKKQILHLDQVEIYV